MKKSPLKGKLAELEVPLQSLREWFPHTRDAPFALIKVSRQHAAAWGQVLGVPLRRCYISDGALEAAACQPGVTKAQVVAAKLPDAGATMSGDFGEIIGFLYQASRILPARALGPKKWRLKQDRTKPAPHSDVVQFVVPSWPAPSADDQVHCSEVKTKATNGNSRPIADAIKDSGKDRTSRLGRTLVWLKERSLTDDLGEVTRDLLDRFLDSTKHPSPSKTFRAIAVVCGSLSAAELKRAPAKSPRNCTLVVITIPELRSTYTAVFAAARRSVPP